MERDTHRVMHTKIKEGEGRGRRERMTNDIMCHINQITTVSIGLCGCSFLCLSINVFF